MCGGGTMNPKRSFLLLVGLVFLGGTVVAQDALVNWESPHVSPLAISPDGTRLFAVNTPDNRLEVFDLTAGTPQALYSIPVGLDPVSVRPQSNSIVWVTNYISDTVSVVNLDTRNVIATLKTGDEPADVVFAGSPQHAFVSCAQTSQVYVFDPANLAAAPDIINIQGQRPRAMTVSPDGNQVYVAIFESGNHSTLIYRVQVSDPTGPYGGVNPPPNSGDAFNPPMTPDLPTPPLTSLIVRKDPGSGHWLDDNQHDWSGFVTWDLHDHDVAVIDANSHSVGYISGLMNINMAIAVRPDGKLTVVGTDATNQIRFEPNVTGKFVHSLVAIIDPASPQTPAILDLNPHLAEAYQAGASNVPPAQRALSVADPRGLALSSNGTAYVAGLGTNNVIAIDSAGQRVGQVDVGAGPTGLVLDESHQRLFVLNKFDASISVVSTDSLTESTRIPLPFDPTPPAIKNGRPLLYDARLTSGLGVTACGACHVDGRKDGLAWDLGNPAGSMKPFNQDCLGVLPGGICLDWHPMKGPLTTQTMQGIIGTEPLHWRGDREDLPAFSGAFVSLLGGDAQPTAQQMTDMESFVATIKFPPNPNRNFDNTLSTNVQGGDAVAGENFFLTQRVDGLVATCVQCHAGPNGTNQQILPALVPSRGGPPQNMKVPQLRDLIYKTGFDRSTMQGDRGFGYLHDGSQESLLTFLNFGFFFFKPGPRGVQDQHDVIAYAMSLSTDTHPAVGAQVTQNGANNQDPAVAQLIDNMLAQADVPAVGLVVKGRIAGTVRGFAYVGGGMFQSDLAAEQVSAATLRTMATADNELTWTVVPLGSEFRIGIDRNSNGVFDGDELPPCTADFNGDHTVDLSDLALLLADYGCSANCVGDVNHDGVTDLADLSLLLSQYGALCP